MRAKLLVFWAGHLSWPTLHSLGPAGLEDAAPVWTDPHNDDQDNTKEHYYVCLFWLQMHDQYPHSWLGLPRGLLR